MITSECIIITIIATQSGPFLRRRANEVCCLQTISRRVSAQIM